MTRALRLACILATCALAATGVRAQDDSGTASDVAARAADVEALRGQMEALYRDAAAQHARLRALVEGFGERAPGTWPEALSSESAREAVRTLVDTIRHGGRDDPGTAGLALPRVLSTERWPLWDSAVLERTVVRAAAEPEAPPVDVWCSALGEVAELSPDAAWDRWLQDHELVASWRRANERLAEARLLAEGRAPTPLVALERARVEVGPWEGWLQDLSEKDNRRQKVTVGAIHVQRHEVTCAQYADFLVARAAEGSGDLLALLPKGWELDADGHASFPPALAKHPVTGVSFLQAAAYADWLGMRLPTEDEWERIAAGAGHPRHYPWGDEVRDVAHRGAGLDGPVAVDRFEADASPEGVLGLAGNVKELVATHPDRKPVKGALDVVERVVIRGGGYRTRPDECTTRWRWFVEAGAQEPDVGFRLVIDDDDLKRRERR